MFIARRGVVHMRVMGVVTRLPAQGGIHGGVREKVLY